MKGDDLLMSLIGVVICFLVIALIITLAGGCTTRPTCAETPRVMRCMTADQLKEELSR